MRRIFFQLIFTWFCLWGVAFAEPSDRTTHLNIATAPVASSSPADLQTAIENAFSQVMVKVSGNSRIMSVPEIQRQIPAADKFVEKYTYIGSDVQVTFDQRALLALLIQAQQPVWVSARPTTLIALSVKGQPPLTEDSAAPNPTVIELQKAAAGRGIPVLFPARDSDDQALWQAKAAGGVVDPSSLEKIAAHYHAPAILSGTLIQQTDQSWAGEWNLVWRGQVWQWRNDGLQAAVLRGGIERLADLIGGQSAININQHAENSVWLAVLGISTLTDYNNVLMAVKKLQPVLGIFVQDVGNNGILLQVTAAGEGADALKKALLDSSLFIPVNGETEAAGVISYRWQPQTHAD